MNGHRKITVTVQVAEGDSCKVKTKQVQGACYFYVSKSCRLFNKVILDHKKCRRCIEACQ